MTPTEMIFASAGLHVPGVPKPNGAIMTDPLEGLTREQLIRMVQAMQVENRNMSQGLQTMQLANDELVEANNYQRAYILELTRENNRLKQKEAKYMAELKANSAIYAAVLDAHIEAMERIEELEGERP